MKKLLTFYLLSIIAVTPLFGQKGDKENQEANHKVQCDAFYKTVPIRDILDDIPTLPEDYFKDAIAKDHKTRRYSDLPELDDHGIPENGNIDPELQTTPAWRTKSWLKAQWTSLGGAFPPDPTGAAGIDYYVHAVNSAYRVYDKEGTPESGSLPLGSLWSTGSDGDPIVMYDRFAERWFISQFQVSTNKILIAISETSDPLGSYYAYEWSYSNFPDYPKYGVWSHSYVLTANMSSQNCTVFEREKMLTGDATASAIKMTMPSHIQFFRSPGIAYAEGPTEPDMDEPCYLFALQETSWSTSIAEDHIKVFKVEVDWSGSGSADVTEHQDIYPGAFNTWFTSSWNDIEQKGTTQKLDAIAGICSYKVQYRRFSDYNVIMLCHTVDVDGANRGGIRWYELRDEDDGNWSIHQQGTWSPDDDNSRWLGNIAMDAQGNIALAYCFSGPNEYAGIRYTGRFVEDPLNEMTVQEQIAVEGGGPQTGGNRYGDYSQMTMDPEDDMTFWFTAEWMAGTNNRKTEVFSFSQWHLLGEDENKKTLPYFNAYQPDPNNITLKWRDITDQNATITMYDMNGKVIVREKVSGSTNEKTYEVPQNASGIYMVRLNGKDTDLSKKVYLGR